MVKKESGEPAIGAVIRVIQPGLVIHREIQSGSGYWSLNGPAQIVPSGVEVNVKFPDGRVLSGKAAAEAKTLIFTADGSVQSE